MKPGIDDEGFVSVDGGEVFYTVVGGGDKTPLLVLHAGPGFSHDLLRKLDGLGDERPIIYYDQLGSGRSERPKDPTLWEIKRFVKELGQVREALELSEVVLFGASWGTMLGVDYLLTEPSGVKAAILGHPCLSASRWKQDTAALLKLLPDKVQNAIHTHEEAGTTDSKDYQLAFMEFVKHFCCRIEPLPKEVLGAFGIANMEVYQHMWGPSEWFPTGNLRDYERVSDLNRIKVPTLFLCGRHDEATPEATALYHQNLPGSKMVVIEQASHLAYWEQEAAYRKEIRAFLNEVSI